jgi:hypothetical protein
MMDQNVAPLLGFYAVGFENFMDWVFPSVPMSGVDFVATIGQPFGAIMVP